MSFQLTHLLRGATFSRKTFVICINFNSRTSCEVRRLAEYCAGRVCHFNSRTSCEVRRQQFHYADRRQPISTHAPLARCDLWRVQLLHRRQHFNSRTSCEVRPQHVVGILLAATASGLRWTDYYVIRRPMDENTVVFSGEPPLRVASQGVRLYG